MKMKIWENNFFKVIETVKTQSGFKSISAVFSILPWRISDKNHTMIRWLKF